MIRRSFSTVFAAAAVFVLGALGTGCQTTPEPAPNLLRVGVSPNAPPIVFKSGGTIGGLEGALARKLGAELGKQVAFVEMPFANLIPALNSNKIDIIMSGMSVTDDRKPLVQFTEPYLGLGITLLVRSSEVATYIYPDVIRLTEIRIGVEPGTTGEAFAQRFCFKATTVPFKNPSDAARALARGEIDVFLHDQPVIASLASQFSTSGLTAIEKPVQIDYLAWGVRRGDMALAQQANAAVRRWKQTGELQQLAKMYINMN